MINQWNLKEKKMILINKYYYYILMFFAIAAIVDGLFFIYVFSRAKIVKSKEIEDDENNYIEEDK